MIPGDPADRLSTGPPVPSALPGGAGVGSGCEDGPVTATDDPRLDLVAVSEDSPVVRRRPPTPDAVLEALDPEQREVALAVSGPVVVLAGAGTGKTRAITHRIAYAALTGQHDPRRTLAVTFTARAAGEMRHRLAELGVEGVQARTFHSAALRQLRYFWPRVVGGHVPEILPSKARVLAPVLRRAGFTDPSLARDVAAEIEWAKSSQVVSSDYVAAAISASREPPGSLTRDNVAELYSSYDDRKTHDGLIDFEDVLLLTVGILDTRTDVAEEVRRAYRWFTVDEYQDVNPLQQRLLDLWLGDRDDLCVVGDASQTIYTFTGANSSYLLGLLGRYPHATEVRLIRSYRSTPQVVSLANRVLASASGAEAALRLELRATREDGPEPRVHAYDDEPAEAAATAKAITALVRRGVPAREIAVLYRINAQSEAFEEALGEAGIPVVLRGESAFFDRGEVREALTRIRGAARGGGDSGDLASDVRNVLTAMGWSAEPPSGSGALRERWENLLRLVTLADDLVSDAPDATLGDLVADLDRRAATQSAPTADGVTSRDRPRRQGSGVGRRLRRWPRPGHLPDPVRRHRRTAGGGASPLLRRRHPGTYPPDPVVGAFTVGPGTP